MSERHRTITEIEMEHDEGDPSIAEAAVEAGMLALMLCAPLEDAGLVVVSVIDWLVDEKWSNGRTISARSPVNTGDYAE